MEALPVGDYDVEVAKSEAVTSSNGKPMIKVTMKVVSGPYERRSVLNQFVMSTENPVALSIFFRHMKAFGLTEDWFMQLGRSGSLEPVANALLGRRARLTLGHRDWQGETRNEVKAVKPYTGAPTAGPAGPSSLPGPVPTPVAGPVPPTPMAAPAQPVAPPPPPPPPAPASIPVAAPVAPAPAPVPPEAVAQPVAAPVTPMPQPPAAPVPTVATATVAEPALSPSANGTSEQPVAPQPPGAQSMPELPF